MNKRNENGEMDGLWEEYYENGKSHSIEFYI